MNNELKSLYNTKALSFRKRLLEFKKLNDKEQFHEFIFCLLTPQSNAQKCWAANLGIN